MSNSKVTYNIKKKKRYNAKKKNYKISKADKALKIALGLKKQLNAEVKRYEYGTFNPNLDQSATTSFLLMNAIPQGITDVTRIGDSLKVLKFELNGHIGWNAASVAQVVRLVVFWDKQATVSTATRLLDNVGTSYVVDAPKAYDSRFETRTLYDQRFILSANDPVRLVRIKIPVGLHTQYSAGTGTILTGALRLAMFSDQGINFPTTNMQAFVYYSDD